MKLKMNDCFADYGEQDNNVETESSNQQFMDFIDFDLPHFGQNTL